MRRLVVALALVLALVVPATAAASTTIGSTTSPDKVRVSMTGNEDAVVIRFMPGNGLEVKTWALSLGSLRVGYYGAPWYVTKPCPQTSTTVEKLPSDIAVDGADSSHLMVNITCANASWSTVVLVQMWHQHAPDFGTQLDLSSPYTVNVSVLKYYGLQAFSRPNPTDLPPSIGTTFDLPTIGQVTFDGHPVLQAATRWSKFSPGGYRGTLKGAHFQTLFGSFTYGGAGVWGPGDRGGKPTNQFGRNVYIDTYNSDFGKGWRRVVGVLSQQPNGTYCYEFSPKSGSNGKTGAGTVYSVTAQGPGYAPDQRTYFTPPSFAFGNDAYTPKTDKWGTNLSDGETQALRNQAAQMGPTWARSVKGTDCAQTLRQLPAGFIP